MKHIQTRLHTIGDEQPCYVIAEIGSNHNGIFDMACELVERAAEAGVNAVKFQTFAASAHYSRKTPSISMYQENVYDLIERLEIDRTWHARLAKVCAASSVDFLDSPCDPEAVELAVSVGMPLLKVASFDMVDHRLIGLMARTGKCVMFSAGMANLCEIEYAVNVCRHYGNDKIIILQCTSLYPAPAHLSNLRTIQTLRTTFNCLTGYSDHTIGDHIPCAAVALGARVIEKHFTLDKGLPGPDHNFAIEPGELRTMVDKIRNIEAALGDGVKNGPREEEMEMYRKARRSIIAASEIRAGDVIRGEDVVIKRPGIGIHPKYLDLVIGRTARRNIEFDAPLTWEDL